MNNLFVSPHSGRMRGGGDINSALGGLPDKLKTELALHVNLKTLKKVTIFQECQPEFLHDLVLKMRAYIFTPGDLICRKGEVAREMFIIADGILEVINENRLVPISAVSATLIGTSKEKKQQNNKRGEDSLTFCSFAR